MGHDMISGGVVTRLGRIEHVARHRCTFCLSEYDTAKEALDCFDSGFECHVNVGDIIVGGRKWCWFDGSKDWIYDHSDDTMKKGASHLDRGYRFYYLCVAITKDTWDGNKNCRLHFPVIHYVTMAMKGRHSNFPMYYLRLPFGKKEPVPLKPLGKAHTDYYTPFCPPRNTLPKSVVLGAKKLLEKKECDCGHERTHQTIGWKSLPESKK